MSDIQPTGSGGDDEFDRLYATLDALSPMVRWQQIMSYLHRPGGPLPPDVLELLAERLMAVGADLAAQVEALPVGRRPTSTSELLAEWGWATSVPRAGVAKIRLLNASMRSMRTVLTEEAWLTSEVWAWPEADQ